MRGGCTGWRGSGEEGWGLVYDKRFTLRVGGGQSPIISILVGWRRGRKQALGSVE